MMTTVVLSPARAAAPPAATASLVAAPSPKPVARPEAPAERLEADENASGNVQAEVQAAEVQAEVQALRATKKRRRVAFEMADIVEFEPTVFTTTVTSGGIPVMMMAHD